MTHPQSVDRAPPTATAKRPIERVGAEVNLAPVRYSDGGRAKSSADPVPAKREREEI